MTFLTTSRSRKKWCEVHVSAKSTISSITFTRTVASVSTSTPVMCGSTTVSIRSSYHWCTQQIHFIQTMRKAARRKEVKNDASVSLRSYLFSLIWLWSLTSQSQKWIVSCPCRMNRDQPNSREKMRDFTVEFLKCAKFTENSQKEFEKFTENSRAPQPLFRGAMLMQIKKICRIAHLKFLTNEYL